MVDLSLRNQLAEGLFQPAIRRFCVRFLAGFMVLTTENRIVEVAVLVDSQIIIGVGGVPERRCRHQVLFDLRPEDVAGVEEELRLEQSRGDDPGFSH